MFGIVSLLYHAVINKRFVIHGDVFHYRELVMVRHKDNELVTKHSIRQFITSLMVSFHTEASSSSSSSSQEFIEKLVNAMYHYVQFDNTFPIIDLYDRDRLIHIELTVPLTQFQRFGHVTFPRFGFSLMGSRNYVILSSSIGQMDVYYPPDFSLLIEQIMTLITLHQPTWETRVPTMILEMLQQAKAQEVSHTTLANIKEQLHSIYLEKAIITLSTHPLFEPRLVKMFENK